jgi:hypothetical protein
MEVGGFILIEANKGEAPAIVRLPRGLALAWAQLLAVEGWPLSA